MESAGRFKLNGFLFVHLLLPCVAAAASIDPAVEESLRQQQRQIQLEQQRLERAQRELEQRRDAPPVFYLLPHSATSPLAQGATSPLPRQPTALPSAQNHVTDES
jgi:hemolysin activation/secretion protein